MTLVTYALIGCGRIAPNHLAAANACGLDIAALCDIRHDAACALWSASGLPGTPPVYADYREMIRTVRPELIAVATDSGMHAEIGLFALEHGCHVIIEKPLAMSLSDADALISAADRADRVLCACHQNRFNPSVQKMREALDRGRFGKLSHIAAHVRWNRGKAYYDQAAWRGKWASDGGCLMNQCIHNADLMRWMLGDIDEVYAQIENRQHPYIEGEDVGIGIVRGKNGALGLLEGTVNAVPKNLEETLYIFGEKGMVKAGGTSVNLIEEWHFLDGADDEATVKSECREAPPNVYGFGHTRLYKDVLRAISERGKPLVDGREGRKALELILAMYKSKKTGRPVKLPMDGFETMKMLSVFSSGIELC